MKRISRVVIAFSLLFLLTSCGSKDKEEPKKREVAERINWELVKQVSGVWLGEGEKEKKVYTIAFKDHELFINNEALEVTGTEKNMVLTQTEKGKIFFYDFQIEGDELTVMPSFPVKEGQTGGVLAPFKLVPIQHKEVEKRNGHEEDVVTYEKAWQDMYALYNEQTPFSLSITQYTKEGDPIFEQVTFDGTQLSYTHDNTKDKFGEKDVKNWHYKQLDYKEKQGADNKGTKAFILSEPVEKEADKEVVFDW
ncbi:DUF4362 domain-containing protein [Vagococcus sp. DIV0080]|uniref:DUF4362 domain-containing protein n=1 Tax=Candidatus Vagococcus giribetii TaxID=2230876 RepID=A0ABS3HRA0_9ENTE|nr:DUF4362 domain-containing protein [Vagococcus sp. DIV0080]MBO0476289.1 DUF4362 domain-containing protein [Vagococcus sp. DIV0080]